MTIEPVVSAAGPWHQPGPLGVIFYDPDEVTIDALAQDDYALIPCDPRLRPQYIPPKPQPTEAHFAELVGLNPGLVGWGEPISA